MAEAPATRSGRRRAERSPRRSPVLLWAGPGTAALAVVLVIVVLLTGRDDDDTAATPTVTANLQMRPVLQEASLPAAASSTATATGTTPGAAPTASPATGTTRPPSTTGGSTATGEGTASGTASATDRATTVATQLESDFAALDRCTIFTRAPADEAGLGCTTATKYLLGPAEITQSEVTSALAVTGEDSLDWLVEVRLSDTGTKRLAALTTRLAEQEGARQKVAVVLDGEILAVVTVRDPLTGGTFQIAGMFTQSQALSLAAALSGPG